MDKLCYSNNGLSYRYVADSYQPQAGEVLFDSTPTVQQLTAAFTGYPAAAAGLAAVQAARAALAAGLAITSTGTGGLNGTYGVGQLSQNNFGNVISYILVNNRFPGGLSSFPWADSSGQVHQFNDVATFKAFATAIADYATLVTLYMDSGGQVGSLPSPNVTII